MNNIKIIIKDHRSDVVLVTNRTNYAEDIEKNKELINDIWWRCEVEYENGKKLSYDYDHNHDGLSPRKIIHINNRYVYANFNFSFDGKREDTADILIKYLDEDFKGTEKIKALRRNDKAYNERMFETSAPSNTKIKPVDNIIEDLIDD